MTKRILNWLFGKEEEPLSDFGREVQRLQKKIDDQVLRLSRTEEGSLAETQATEVLDAIIEDFVQLHCEKFCWLKHSSAANLLRRVCWDGDISYQHAMRCALPYSSRVKEIPGVNS